MRNLTTPQNALNQCRSAGENWRALRVSREDRQQQVDALKADDDKPADYGERMDNLREWLDVLEWQINCAAREGIMTQRRVMDACVNEALTAFMAAHGSELTSALAPYLNGSAGLNAAMQVLRLAIVRQAENSQPVAGQSYQAILDETGLFPDEEMRKDCFTGYTPARHFRYQFRLKKLNAQQGAG